MSVRGRGTGCLHCAGEAIWIHLRAKGSGGRKREVEHQRVCEAEGKPECLEGQKERRVNMQAYAGVNLSVSRMGGQAWAGVVLLEAGRDCQARGGLVEGRGKPGQS